MRLVFEPVGEVRSSVSPLRGAQWGDVVSELHLTEALTEGLEGIEQFSHLVVLFWMHRAVYLPEQDLRRRPAGRQDMPCVGIFAQRASARPNSLGVSVVRLLGRTGSVLSVQGLDAIDRSPVLDVKPYFTAFDRARRPTEPEWVGRLMQDYF